MPFIGNQPALSYTSFAVQHFTTSATTSYTLDYSVANENEIRLVINNVVQQPGSSYAYTASGTTLTLSAATSATDTMYAVFLGKAVQTVTPASGSVTGAMMSYPLTNFSSTGIDDNADATAITIDSSENVGIGETSPLGKLHVKSADSGATPITAGDELVVEGGSGNIGMSFLSTGGNGQFIYFGDDADNNIGSIKYDHGDNHLQFVTNASEAMRIKSDGGVWVGATSTNPSAATSGNYATINNIYPFQATNNNICQILNRNSSTGVILEFKYNGSFKGSISTNGSTISYNTSSDHRLKENIADISNATDRVKQLQPKRFNFIEDADTTVDGFLAHEVSSVVPEAITGTHNEVDADGNPVYQTIDQAKLVPVLTKALQEAITKIEELETRIQTLENN